MVFKMTRKVGSKYLCVCFKAVLETLQTHLRRTLSSLPTFPHFHLSFWMGLPQMSGKFKEQWAKIWQLHLKAGHCLYLVYYCHCYKTPVATPGLPILCQGLLPAFIPHHPTHTHTTVGIATVVPYSSL